MCSNAPPEELLGPGKPLGLIAYLAFSPGRSASRDHLIDLLWADVEPEGARHSLRQTLWFIRQRLGEDAVLTRDDKITLGVTIQSDHDAFLYAVECLDSEGAVELYQGDFLPGFAAPGGADFEHWADLERHRLALLFRRAAEAAVKERLQRGQVRKARQLAARVRDIDRHDERGWRLLLETVLAANDQATAELEAQALERLLSEEDRPPEPATGALLALVRETPRQEGESPKPSLTPELIGREKEFSTILSAWEAARHGGGQHVHVSGVPGLGKTRLLADVYARLRAMGARAVHLRANPGERQIAYALGSEIALSLGRLPGSAAISPGAAAALVALNPTLSGQYPVQADGATDAEALRRREIAVEELLAAVADEQPVAVLLDDVHWADALSRQLLTGILGKLSAHPVLAVTAARPGPDGATSSPACEQLTLNPLSVAETGSFIASLGALPTAPWAECLADVLHAATHGSPLLILQTLRLALERGWLALAEDHWECPDVSSLSAELARGGPMRRRVAELSRQEAGLVLLCSAAGAAVDASTLARAAEREENAVLVDLTALEVRGLVAREGAQWLPAHDEIAARAIEIAGAEGLQAAHASIGRALAENAGDQPRMLFRAGRQLADGDDEERLGQVFHRWVLAARRIGDRRPLRSLAASLLGESTNVARVDRLVAALPARIRLGLTSRILVTATAALAGVMAVGLLALVFRPALERPDAVLYVMTQVTSSDPVTSALPLRREGWERVKELRLEKTSTLDPELVRALARAESDPVPSPDAAQWAFVRTMPDSGGRDLFVVDLRGEERRVASSPKDDGNPAWSPDSRKLVFETDRWNANSWGDLAILDLATGRVRQLTSGDAVDCCARWSPDGARIAFVRHHGTPSRPARSHPERELCWITPADRTARCFALSFDGVVKAWYDPHQVLVDGTDSSGAHLLARIDVNTYAASFEKVGTEGTRWVSNDGRWVACLCRRSGFTDPQWIVYPTDRPDEATSFRKGYALDSKVFWGGAGDRSAYVDRLEIERPAGPIPVEVVEQLRARGFDSQGRPAPVVVLLWRSGDTSVAAVDRDSGLIRPRKIGSVVVHATAGGWREDSIRIVIGPRDSKTVLVEDWERDLESEWIPLGDPLPTVTRAPNGRSAFWNRGDDYFHSGAYSRRQWRSDRGLGSEALVFAPITALRAQILGFKLLSWTDSSRVAGWDHRTGALPISPNASTCGFTYPAGDGPRGLRRANAAYPNELVDSTLSTGAPYIIRLQIFPDGTCGVAVNGRPLGRGRIRMPLSAPYRVVLEGKSVGTKVLVGRLEVWEGVRNGVDWSALNARLAPTR